MTNTPANKPFDAEMHTFGMAYKHKETGLVYGFDFNGGRKNSYVRIYCPKSKYRIADLTNFTRAPEHDLIPRQDVDALIEALESVDDEFEQVSRNTHKLLPYRSAVAVSNQTREQVKQALSQFQQKHGVK